MGMVIIFVLFVGVIAGLLVSGSLILPSIIVMIRSAKYRSHVWTLSIITIVVSIGVLLLLTHIISNVPVSPGSDYDVVMRNLLIKAVAYSATPGISAFFGALASCLCPKKNIEIK